MTTLQEQVAKFTKNNERVCYFDYSKRENGVDPRKKEDNLNILLYLIKGYNFIYLIGFPVPEECKTIFVLMTTIIKEEIPVEEKIEELKKELFLKEKTQYQETLKGIQWIQNNVEEVIKNSYLPYVVDLIIKKEEKMQELKSI